MRGRRNGAKPTHWKAEAPAPTVEAREAEDDVRLDDVANSAEPDRHDVQGTSAATEIHLQKGFLTQRK
jgi:hypothetical protein